MNKKNQQKTLSWSIIYVLVFALILGAIYIYFFKNTLKLHVNEVAVVTNQTSSSDIYHSEQMDISFKVPKDYVVKESFNTIYLTKNNIQIVIDRISTNSPDIPGYLDVHQQLQKVEINAQKVTINDYEIYKGMVNFPISKRPVQYSYYIYTAPWTIIVITSQTDDATTLELVKSLSAP